MKVIIERAATKLIETNAELFTTLYKKLKDANFADCVCKACAVRMKSLDAAKGLILRRRTVDFCQNS